MDQGVNTWILNQMKLNRNLKQFLGQTCKTSTKLSGLSILLTLNETRVILETCLCSWCTPVLGSRNGKRLSHLISDRPPKWAAYDTWSPKKNGSLSLLPCLPGQVDQQKIKVFLPKHGRPTWSFSHFQMWSKIYQLRSLWIDKYSPSLLHINQHLEEQDLQQEFQSRTFNIWTGNKQWTPHLAPILKLSIAINVTIIHNQFSFNT